MDTSQIGNNEPFSKVQITAFIKEEVLEQRKVLTMRVPQK